MNINEDFEIRQLLMQASEVCPFSDEKWAVQEDWVASVDPIQRRRQIPGVPSGTSAGA